MIASTSGGVRFSGRPRGLKPSSLLRLRGAEAPLFHGAGTRPGCCGRGVRRAASKSWFRGSPSLSRRLARNDRRKPRCVRLQGALLAIGLADFFDDGGFEDFAVGALEVHSVAAEANRDRDAGAELAGQVAVGECGIVFADIGDAVDFDDDGGAARLGLG